MLKPGEIDEDYDVPEKLRPPLKATGMAADLLNRYEHLAGHPVWMGIGVNGMYTDEKVLQYIEWAMAHKAGTFWLVLAHELGAENKLAYKKPGFHERRSTMREGVEHFTAETRFGLRRVATFEDSDNYDSTPERAEQLVKIEEYRAMAEQRKTELRDKVCDKFRFLDAVRICILTIDEMYRYVIQRKDPYMVSTKNLLAEALMQNPAFQADMDNLFQIAVPNFWNQMQSGKVYMPSAYRYTIEQIFLTYALRFSGIGLKVGPITEEGPDEIYEKFVGGGYNIAPHNTPGGTGQGFIYL